MSRYTRHNNKRMRQRTASAAFRQPFRVRDLWHADRTMTCGICHEIIECRAQASIDHIVPLSRGGAETRANIRLAHKSCNRKRGNHMPLESQIA